jgi:hypothetical protein
LAATSIRRGLLVGLTAGALAFTAVPAASAATGAANDRRTAGASTATAQHTAERRHATERLRRDRTGTLRARHGGKSIKCRVYVRDPHRAGHGRRGAVRASSHVRCNRKVRHIRIRMHTYRDGHSMHRGGQSSYYSRHASDSIARKCRRNSAYRNVTHVRVKFPRKYHPVQSSIAVHGGSVSMHRCR